MKRLAEIIQISAVRLAVVSAKTNSETVYEVILLGRYPTDCAASVDNQAS